MSAGNHFHISKCHNYKKKTSNKIIYKNKNWAEFFFKKQCLNYFNSIIANKNKTIIKKKLYNEDLIDKYYSLVIIMIFYN